MSDATKPKIGLMWFDDRSVLMGEKVTGAAERYCEKSGAEPTTCYIHPLDFEAALPPKGNGTMTVNGIEVKPLKTMLRYHLWLIEENEE